MKKIRTMNKGTVYLHIGAQRTGTTFLQRCVFNNINFYKHNIFFYTNENTWANIWDKDDNRLERLKILHHCIPDAKIIFGCRKKESLKKSLYRKYVTQGGTRQFKDFDEVINTHKLDLKKYVNRLLDIFDDVLVYHHEDLVAAHERVVREICDFMSVPVPEYRMKKLNVGYGRYMLPLARNLNKLFKNDFNPQGFIPCHYYRLPHRFLYQEVFSPIIKKE